MESTPDSGSSSSSLISNMTTSSSLPVFYNPNAIMGQTYLTKENYINWANLFKTLLRTHNLLYIINPDQPPAKLPDGSDNPKHTLWKKGTDLVCGWIKGTVTPSVQPYLNSCDTAPSAWTALSKRFGASSALQIDNLKEKLHDLKKAPDTSISDYLLRASSISDSLTAAGDPVDEAVLIQRVLGGLGQEYKELLTVVAAIHAQNPLTFDALTDLLLKEETLLLKFATSAPTVTALAVVKNNNTPAPVLSPTGNRGGGNNNNRGNRQNNRNRFGGNRGNGGYQSHRQWNNSWNPSWNNHAGLGRGSGNIRGRGNGFARGGSGHNTGRGLLPKPNITCQLCFTPGHRALECNNYNAHMAYTDPYILDSGATNHMTADPSSFSGSYPYSGQSDEGDFSFWQ